MNPDRPEETGTSSAPLTRADIEALCRQIDSPAKLDVRYQNLQNINLAYMDLHGANLQGANLQGADLRGTNLCDADLQEANLSEADLDGAVLSRAHLGANEVTRVNLHKTNLSYATLRELDLRGFDLSGLSMQCADLNGSDLRGATLNGTDLRGADLSTALLHGPELRGAKLHGDIFLGNRAQKRPQNNRKQKVFAPNSPSLIQERASLPLSEETEQVRETLSDRDAYLLGKQVLLADADPVKIRLLFPQGFTFASARRIFDTWLAKSERHYSEEEVQAIWVGFAHRICELYYADMN